MNQNNVSKATISRLPVYLHYLKSLRADSDANISATAIAKFLGYGEVQVRKDLSAVSGAGKPKTGYVTEELIEHIESFLGYKNTNKAVIAGAGKLGKALLDYDGFKEYGFQISAAFDISAEKTGKTESGKNIFPMQTLSDFCRQNDIKIGIITVPADSSQQVCDEMVNSGIRAIWNFAPAHLKAPEDIIVQNENMALSLAMLSVNLNKQNKIY